MLIKIDEQPVYPIGVLEVSIRRNEVPRQLDSPELVEPILPDSVSYLAELGRQQIDDLLQGGLLQRRGHHPSDVVVVLEELLLSQVGGVEELILSQRPHSFGGRPGHEPACNLVWLSFLVIAALDEVSRDWGFDLVVGDSVKDRVDKASRKGRIRIGNCLLSLCVESLS